jgi:upstream activation factor subunit UAF30
MATKKAKKAAPKKAAKKAAPKKAAKKAAPKKAAKKAAPKKAAKKAAPKKAAAPKKKVAKKKSARKPNAAFMKALTPSADLGAVIGAKPVPRTEAVKKIWVYIKANKLQDSKNKRMINADAKLKAVFGGKAQVSMFDMAKHLSNHLK